MRNISTIAKFELKRLFRDWRLVAMVLSQPILIAVIVGLVANHGPEHIKVLVHETEKGKYSQMLINELEAGDELDVSVTDRFDNEDIRTGRARAIVEADFSQHAIYSGEISVKTDPTAGIAAFVAQQKIAEAAAKIARAIAAENVGSYVTDRQKYLRESLPTVPSNMISLTINEKSYDPLALTFHEGTDAKIKYFDYYGSSMMVVLVLLVVLNLSGISITSERASGTFERITVTPYRKSDIIIGKAAALFLVGLVVNLLGIASLKLLYGINLGNIYLLLTTTILVVGMAVNLGLLVSSVTRNVVESVEMAMYVFFVSFLLSGILLPVETAHPVYASIVKALPFYHAVNASRNINMLGAGWADIQGDLGIVFAYVVGFILSAMIALRREAK